jgi:hypothetical protein
MMTSVNAIIKEMNIQKRDAVIQEGEKSQQKLNV